MNPKIYALAVLLFCSCSAYSQVPDWLWAKGIGGSSYEIGYGIANDPAGNVVVTGQFMSSPLDFGGTLLTCSGTDIFIAKYSPLGILIWAKSAGGTGDDKGYCITTDASGNVYVAGSFTSPVINFDGYTMANSGGTDVFIAKYDPQGIFLWARSAAGTDVDVPWSIGCDSHGNPYVTGKFISPSINFGNGAMLNAGDWDIFLAKYNPSGTLQWARRFGGSSWDNGNCIIKDNTGRMYLAGYFESSTITFDSFTLIETDSVNLYGDAYIARMDESGNVLWAKNAGGSDWDECAAVAADTYGNAYLAGYFLSPSISFDSIVLNNSAPGFYDIFIAKYDSLGNVHWAKQYGGNNDDFANAIAVDNSGKISISGNFLSTTVNFNGNIVSNHGQSDIFVTCFGPSGNALWAKATGENENEGCQCISVDQNGSIYINAAFFSDSVVCGNFTLMNANAPGASCDILIARIDTFTYTSVPDLPHEADAAFSVFPNPAEDRFTLTVPSDTKDVMIFNAVGQMIQHVSVSGQTVLNFEIEGNGFYFIKVYTAGETLSRKLVLYQ